MMWRMSISCIDEAVIVDDLSRRKYATNADILSRRAVKVRDWLFEALY